MTEIINIEQGSQEWHDLRAKYIRTASRTPTVLDCSPFSNWEKLAKEIKFGIKPYYSKAMQLGNELEDMIKERAEVILGDSFQPIVGINDGYLASLDGLNFDGDTLIEIKCSDKTYEEVLNGQVPEHYFQQIIHQMMVFEDVERAYLVAYSSSKDKIEISDCIYRLDVIDHFETIKDKWKEFESYMEDYELPEVEEVTNDTALELADKYEEALRLSKFYEEQAKSLKDGLLGFVNGAKTKIGNLSITKSIRKGTIDYKALLKDKNIDDVDAYKKADTEVFSIKVG